MSQQSIKQRARRTAREVAERRRQARMAKESRIIDLVQRVIVAIGERDKAVVEAEARAGAAIREWTDCEKLTLVELVEWCDGLLEPREAARLRRLPEDVTDGGAVASGARQASGGRDQSRGKTWGSATSAEDGDD